MNILSFDNIHRYFKPGKNVLDGVTFQVDEGDVVGLIGRNGAGKTTLINIAMGMLRSQGGNTEVLGLNPAVDSLSIKKQIGYVSEDQVLPEFLKVSEVLTLHRGLFPQWDTGLENELLDRFRIRTDARIKELSKGEARQVALLCAVSHRPKLLLLDEPAGGLDPSVRREFLETSIRLLNDAGSTILFSSHYMTDVERMANRIVMLHGGHVLLNDTMDDLLEQHSLVRISAQAGLSIEQLQKLDGCISARTRNGSIHAILRTNPQVGRQRVGAAIGSEDLRCDNISLEEMFIELLGAPS
jgi:ABC-2 type transport system ATP-binding protein